MGLDSTDRQILQHLAENARLSWADLGRSVGLSPPAVAERVRRLEEAGIITGYHARLNREKLGVAVQAFVQVQVAPSDYPRFKTLVKSMATVLTCHHVTGDSAFVVRVGVGSIADLEGVVTQLSRYGETQTTVILSTVVDELGSASDE